MKTSFLALIAAIEAFADAACPFELMKRSGILTDDDLAKFDFVKQNPEAAEALFRAHTREAKPEPAPQGGIIGPILGGALDLPFGGGLRGFLAYRHWTLLTSCPSEWSTPTTYRRAPSHRYTYPPGDHP